MGGILGALVPGVPWGGAMLEWVGFEKWVGGAPPLPPEAKKKPFLRPVALGFRGYRAWVRFVYSAHFSPTMGLGDGERANPSGTQGGGQGITAPRLIPLGICERVLPLLAGGLSAHVSGAVFRVGRFQGSTRQFLVRHACVTT